MNKFFNQVAEFNETVLNYPKGLTYSTLPKDVKELSLIQLREEITELQYAKCMTEEADALVDLIYFAMGALYKMGINESVFTDISTAVHEANMKKAAGKKAAREYEGTAQDAIKPADFIPPDYAIADILNDDEFWNQMEGECKL